MVSENNQIAFMDGVFLSVDQLRIPISDGFSLDDEGIYSTLRVDNGVVESYVTHLRVFDTHCHEISMYSPFVMEQWVVDLLHYNNAMSGIWELKLFAIDREEISEDRSFRSFSHLLITIRKAATSFREPLSLSLLPLSTEESFTRVHSIVISERCGFSFAAEEKGVDDFLLTNSSEQILEASFSNIFWLKGGTIYTPDPDLPLSFGVALMTILCAAETSLGLNVQYVKGSLSDIPEDAYVFLCNSMHHFQPVKKIQDRLFLRNLDFEEDLSQAYERLVLEFSLDCR